MSGYLFLKFLGIDISLIMIGLGIAWFNPRFYRKMIRIRNIILDRSEPPNIEIKEIGKGFGGLMIFLGLIWLFIVLFV